MRKILPKNMLFFRYLGTYILLFSIPLLLVIAILNRWFYVPMENQEILTKHQKLSNIRNMLDIQFNQLYKTAYEIGRNPSLYPFAFENDPYQAKTVIDILNTYNTANDFFDETFLYFYDDSYIYTSATSSKLSLYFKHVLAYENYSSDDIQALLNNTFERTIIPSQTVYPRSQIPKNALTMLFPVSHSPGGPYFAVIGFIIYEKTLTEYMYETGETASYTLIYDDSGKLIFAPYEKELTTDIISKIENELVEMSEGENVSIDINGETFFSVKESSLGFSYYNFSPKAVILKNVNTTKTTLMIIFVSLSILGAVMIIIALRKQYVPLHHLQKFAKHVYSSHKLDGDIDDIDDIVTAMDYLNQKNNLLTNRLESYSSVIKDYMASRLLNGFVKTKADFDAIASECGYSPCLEKFCCGVIGLPEYSNDVNVMDTLSQYIDTLDLNQHTCIPKYDLISGRIILILNSNESTRSIYAFFEQMHHEIKSQFNIDTTLGVGNIYTSLSYIKKSYQEAYTALEQSFLKGKNELLFFRKMSTNISQIISYTIEQTDLIKKAILKNDLFLLESLLDGFTETIQESSAPLFIVKGISFYLLIQVSNAWDTKENTKIPDITAYNNLFSLSETETLGQLTENIMKFYTDMSSIGQEKSDKGISDPLLGRIIAFIKQNYNQYDFSIQIIADHFEMSSPHICQYFHVRFGSTILAYITDLRIEASLPLLTNTELSLDEIAQKVGYLNSASFVRRFKKTMGITPSNFKKLKRNTAAITDG